MLDAVLREFQPVCEALSIPILVSDNASTDSTPEVCEAWARRWPGFRFRRHPQTLPAGRSVMSAIEMSDAEYTWLSGDDDCLLQSGIRWVASRLAQHSPDAIVVRTIEVPWPDYVELRSPVGPQIAPVVARDAGNGGLTVHTDAGRFFASRHIILPAPTVIYRTAPTLATNYERYQETHHAHIGALFDALAVEQARRGRIDVVETDVLCSVSLTVHHDRGKDQWTDIFRYLGTEGFPKWFSLLPALYAPYVHVAEAHYRHIFRDLLSENDDDQSQERTR